MSNKKGEIATILTVGSLIVLGVVSLISSVFLKKTIKTQPRATSCSQVESVRFSPSSINAGQTFTCNLSGKIVNPYTMACGWSKNGGWPLGQRSGSCRGNSCTFQVKMEDQVDPNAFYELVGFDFRDECGPVTGKREPLNVAGVNPQPTPTLPPGQGDCEEGKRDITGACNPACCDRHDQCPSNHLCNISNGYCRSGFSCNPNSFIPPTQPPNPTSPPGTTQPPTPTPKPGELGGDCINLKREDNMFKGDCDQGLCNAKTGKCAAPTSPPRTTQPPTPTPEPGELGGECKDRQCRVGGTTIVCQGYCNGDLVCNPANGICITPSPTPTPTPFCQKLNENLEIPALSGISFGLVNGNEVKGEDITNAVNNYIKNEFPNLINTVKEKSEARARIIQMIDDAIKYSFRDSLKRLIDPNENILPGAFFYIKIGDFTLNIPTPVIGPLNIIFETGQASLIFTGSVLYTLFGRLSPQSPLSVHVGALLKIFELGASYVCSQ